VCLLADKEHMKPGFVPAVENWRSQFGPKRPVEARQTPARALHDRLIIADEKTVYSLTQSFNRFADRSPGCILRVDADTAILKLEEYKKMWADASPIAKLELQHRRLEQAIPVCVPRFAQI
jgi:hypothetical protein